MKESEFKERIARIDRNATSCVEIWNWIGSDFRTLYYREFHLTQGTFWISYYLHDSDAFMKDVDNYGNLYECADLSKWMLRDFLLGMFQYYVINYTDMLEEG